MKWLLMILALSCAPVFGEGEGILRAMNSCMANAYSSSDEYQCARNGYRRADALLNARWQSITSWMRSRDLAELRADQHSWLNNTRNYECQANPDTGRTFSNAPIGADEYACFARITIKRVTWLSSTYGD